MSTQRVEYALDDVTFIAEFDVTPYRPATLYDPPEGGAVVEWLKVVVADAWTGGGQEFACDPSHFPGVIAHMTDQAITQDEEYRYGPDYER